MTDHERELKQEHEQLAAHVAALTARNSQLEKEHEMPKEDLTRMDGLPQPDQQSELPRLSPVVSEQDFNHGFQLGLQEGSKAVRGIIEEYVLAKTAFDAQKNDDDLAWHDRFKRLQRAEVMLCGTIGGRDGGGI